MDSARQVSTTKSNLDKLLVANRSNQQLTNDLKSARRCLPLILERAESSDFNSTSKSNGYRQVIHNLHWIIKIAGENSKTPEESTDWIKVASWIAQWTAVAIEIEQDDAQANQKFLAFIKSYLGLEEIRTILNLRLAKYTFKNKIPQRLLEISNTVGAIAQSNYNVKDFIRTFVDRKFAKDQLRLVLTRSEVETTTRLARFADFRFLGLLHKIANRLKYPNVIADRIKTLLNCTYNLVLDKSTGQVTLVEEKTAEKLVDFTIFKHRKYAESSQGAKIVFFVHGCGFAGGSTESYSSFITEIANQLEDTILISVDYELAPKEQYPGQLQTLLTLYCWITSGSCPILKSPKKIASLVLMGDSAGGNLIMSLGCILNDIRFQFGEDKIRRPECLVPIYAALDCRFRLGVTKVLEALNTGLSPWHLFNYFRNYIPLQIPMTNQDFCSNDKLVPEYEQALKLAEHPYISPICYDYQLFKDAKTKLLVISPNGCPLHDQSVQLAKLWPEIKDCELLVFDRLCHGTMQLFGIDPESQEFVQVLVRKLRRMLNYQINKAK